MVLQGQEIDLILFCNNDLIWIISFSRPNFSFDFCDQVRLRSQTCLLLQSQSKVSEKERQITSHPGEGRDCVYC